MVYPVLCTAGCYVMVITLFIKKVGVVRPNLGGPDPPTPQWLRPCGKQLTSISLAAITLTQRQPFNGLISRTAGTRKVKPIWILMNQELTGWQWHQLDHMQIICILLQTDNYACTSAINFLHAGCSSWCPTNSVKALTAKLLHRDNNYYNYSLFHYAALENTQK